MNRTFHARTSWYQLLYIFIVACLCFYMIWIKQSIIATVLAVLLLVLIERLIHTDYILTSQNTLIINKGRFTKPREIALSTITDIEEKTSAKFGSFYVTSFVLLTLKNNQYIALTPTHATRFVDTLIRRKENYIDQ